ncbi:N-acetylmuramoyl-L-alanine amidase family protein [Clostridium formicaceticum]|uniref:Germination-specific N-acetylmuramoyl-L-alanine amidase n=1 Tax=Clostridium formicaceticum TaxID=1497 RepID=A0AAC9RJ38_9CLOT|nr:N-acetylmuramoyl-L-alanine amidase [Clostridium formicaceticum]AOY75895.1 hypothetical protein BJL90_08310 [Clostridium formicaceticum]ARE86238.1 Germination-specific N-acetylmuramoyl-L-alanine amidase precursor [Clostridium formicaceticum]
MIQNFIKKAKKKYFKKDKSIIFIILPQWLFLALSIAIVGLAFSFVHQTITSISNKNVLLQSTVVIDAGHGGIDGGTYDKHLMLLEKDINLDVALKIQKILQRNDITAVVTREKDVSLEEKSNLKSTRHARDLDARRQIIDGSRGSLFVSIHVDAQPKNLNTRGVKIFYNKNSEESKKIAEEIKKSVDFIVYDEFLDSSSMKAEIAPGNFYVLRATKTPGVLVEIGYITNLEDKKLLQQETYKKHIALAVSDGIIRYLFKTGDYF